MRESQDGRRNTYSQALSRRRGIAGREVPEGRGEEAECDGEAPLDDDKADVEAQRAEREQERQHGHGQEEEAERRGEGWLVEAGRRV